MDGRKKESLKLAVQVMGQTLCSTLAKPLLPSMKTGFETKVATFVSGVVVPLSQQGLCSTSVKEFHSELDFSMDPTKPHFSTEHIA